MRLTASDIKQVLAEGLQKRGESIETFEQNLHDRDMDKVAAIGATLLSLLTRGAAAGTLGALGLGAVAGTGLYGIHKANQDTEDKRLKRMKEMQDYQEATKSLQQALSDQQAQSGF